MADWKTSLFRKVDRLHRGFNERIKHRWPLLSVWLYHKPRSRFLHYGLERALSAGRGPQGNDHPSVALFTVNKAASMHANRMLVALAKAHGLLPVDYAAWIATTSGKAYELLKDPTALGRMFRPKGFYFGALRDHCAIPDVERFRVVVVVRDPRDVLTSKYYSQAFSHAVINERVHARRKKVRQQTIDAFVLEQASDLHRIYSAYAAHFGGRPNALLTTYEHMTRDHDTWLREIATHTGLDGHPEVIQKLLNDARQVKGTGDKKQHLRVARPGDHKEKLKAETIADLDRLFADVMTRFAR